MLARAVHLHEARQSAGKSLNLYEKWLCLHQNLVKRTSLEMNLTNESTVARDIDGSPIFYS
jgi:hypothetical protein